MIATAESCTAGLIAGLLTEIAGSSRVRRTRLRQLFERSQSRNCSRAARTESRITAPVSEAVVRAMAAGALDTIARRMIVVAVSGVAGPGGGHTGQTRSASYILACARRGGTVVQSRAAYGDPGRAADAASPPIRRCAGAARRRHRSAVDFACASFRKQWVEI